MMSGTYSLYQENIKEETLPRKAKQLKNLNIYTYVYYCTSIKQQYIKLLHCV